MISTDQAPPNSASEELPPDFEAYLAGRLGVGRDDALATLGQWLKQYEPSECRKGLATGRPRRSGVFPCSEPAEAHVTAKTNAA
jgi:hypothetical protein